jgi:predicted esterase
VPDAEVNIKGTRGGQPCFWTSQEKCCSQDRVESRAEDDLKLIQDIHVDEDPRNDVEEAVDAVDGEATHTGDSAGELPNWYGVMSKTKGDRYKSNFVSGRYHGQGNLVAAIGKEFHGQWVQDRAHGVGTQAHGAGTHTLVSGITHEGLEAVLMSAKAKGKTALCIWFHYLAGKGADWEHALKAKIGNQLPWVEWYFPDAPKRPVTNYSGSIERCWFDQLEGQVTESMATPGLEVSISMVHGLLRQAEAHGFPSHRILLGGMSQGGVLAMTAGFSYDKPLAGIMAVSAWVPPCLSFMSLRHPSTPLMIGNGDRDDVVPISIFQKGAKKLAQAGCSRITTKVYPGLDHTWKDFESQDVKQFIQSVTSSNQLNAGHTYQNAVQRWGN